MEPITQDTPQPTPRVDQLKNFIDKMDIKKTPNKRTTPTPSSEINNPTQENRELDNNYDIDSATQTSSSSRKSRLFKIQQKEHIQSLRVRNYLLLQQSKATEVKRVIK